MIFDSISVQVNIEGKILVFTNLIILLRISVVISHCCFGFLNARVSLFFHFGCCLFFGKSRFITYLVEDLEVIPFHSFNQENRLGRTLF